MKEKKPESGRRTDVGAVTEQWEWYDVAAFRTVVVSVIGEGRSRQESWNGCQGIAKTPKTSREESVTPTAYDWLRL